MNELTWPQRGRLWLRLGLRLLLLLLGLWALVRLGPPLISLFAPFLLALLMSWLLSPAVRRLHEHFGISRRFLSLFLLLLVFILLAAILWALAAGAARELVALAGNWEALVASLQAQWVTPSPG
jgi:predicted PurR-regulated permease PerM